MRLTTASHSTRDAGSVATLRHPLDDPRMAPFVEMLDPVNDATDGTPGFVWRLAEEGAADGTGPAPGR
ncbi:DUF3291 domain-containing protein [Streptomyces sp. NPDC001165]|uniref:DUF3291 domain-containing protein n=1 Tax=Streptomyces sp. NPDC001165 TaxID=3364546 RepID=UPI0036C570D3